MNNHNHTHNFALFMILLSLLFIPVGSFGLAKIAPSSDVLSVSSVRTISLDEVIESTSADIKDIDETSEFIDMPLESFYR